MAMQFQSDMLQIPVQRPREVETTALGAAYLAGLAVGYWNDVTEIEANWHLGHEYAPEMSSDDAISSIRGGVKPSAVPVVGLLLLLKQANFLRGTMSL